MPKNRKINLFQLEYDWHEGEHGETLLGKNAGAREFERDLREAKKFARGLIGKKIEKGDYLGRGYSVECLPEYYGQVVWFLTKKKGYIECKSDESVRYQVDSLGRRNIRLTRLEKITRESRI